MNSCVLSEGRRRNFSHGVIEFASDDWSWFAQTGMIFRVTGSDLLLIFCISSSFKFQSWHMVMLRGLRRQWVSLPCGASQCRHGAQHWSSPQGLKFDCFLLTISKFPSSVNINMTFFPNSSGFIINGGNFMSFNFQTEDTSRSIQVFLS